jgi:hypothetical protein
VEELDFIQIYKEWLANRVWAAREELPAKQRKLLALADSAKKRAWNSLPEARRGAIVKELVSQDLLPQNVLSCINIFDAQVVGI